MKNKYFKTALCLGVGVITLTAAVFANYDNANGYSVCKNAAKSILFETNYTLNTRIEMKVDGESMGKYEAVYKTAGKQDPNKYTSSAKTVFIEKTFISFMFLLNNETSDTAPNKINWFITWNNDAIPKVVTSAKYADTYLVTLFCGNTI